MNKISESQHYMDLAGLDKLRSQAKDNDPQALRAAAEQFEGLFMQMVLKSMREANAAFESDSPFNTQYTQFYQQMHDQQMSVDLSQKGSLGLADLIVTQLGGGSANFAPASSLRGGLDSQTVMAPAVVKPSEQVADTKKLSEESKQASVQAEASPQATGFFDQAEDFINQLTPMAIEASQKLGTSPALLLAQSALETGWGRKIVKRSNGESSFNLFNIKADRRWNGDKTQVATLEFEQGVAVKKQADFRAYQGFQQSFDDFVSFLQSGSRYQSALDKAASPGEFIDAIHQAGYATDPNYGDKVKGLMEQITRQFGGKFLPEADQ
ncbi:flagellar assembly peptidoglycan hydrolase FlgJ [Paraferrimonas sedimenticola]|uniref:Peptidoglycan hydrolase FlgJ n=1 Tax=Paraferrimonas sedimenticola TaxID=375674 RepID=A0AA37RUW3_9GAMM|nr:flagellar assembly peptidoglycan hydrolase FlgJ [Paraferrimonas sedimenticola]GLP94987.1 flagellar rod assembly protein/muramidase FlgJ [Paraferrimonas sedimenticola]